MAHRVRLGDFVSTFKNWNHRIIDRESISKLIASVFHLSAQIISIGANGRMHTFWRLLIRSCPLQDALCMSVRLVFVILDVIYEI